MSRNSFANGLLRIQSAEFVIQFSNYEAAMESLLILGLPAHAIAMGALAQIKYGKTGLWWGLGTFGVSLVLAFFFDHAVTSNPRWQFDPAYRANITSAGGTLAQVLLVFGISTGLVWLALASLPKRDNSRK
jgi:hypothetical protein